jgi:hypothetical protein
VACGPASGVPAYIICRIHDHAEHLLRMDDNEAAGAAIGEASEIAQWLRCQPLSTAQTIQAGFPHWGLMNWQLRVHRICQQRPPPQTANTLQGIQAAAPAHRHPAQRGG